jgi:hypothetical protein
MYLTGFEPTGKLLSHAQRRPFAMGADGWVKIDILVGRSVSSYVGR